VTSPEQPAGDWEWNGQNELFPGRGRGREHEYEGRLRTCQGTV